MFICDQAESELGVLDLIQVFVEALDRMFENVCELDLVFGFDEVSFIPAYSLIRCAQPRGPSFEGRKRVPNESLTSDRSFRPQVHHTLAEIIQGGLVLETNINTISANGPSLLFPSHPRPSLSLSAQSSYQLLSASTVLATAKQRKLSASSSSPLTNLSGAAGLVGGSGRGTPGGPGRGRVPGRSGGGQNGWAGLVSGWGSGKSW